MRLKMYLQRFALGLSLVFLAPGSVSASKQEEGPETVRIFLISPEDRKGEQGYLQGIDTHLQAAGAATETLSLAQSAATPEQMQVLQERIGAFLKTSPQAEAVIVATGQAGIHALPGLLKELRQQYQNKLFSAYISHQVMDGVAALARSKDEPSGVDLLVFPEHALDETFKALIKKSSSEFLLTTDVPHNTTSHSVTQAYQKAVRANPKLFPLEPKGKGRRVVLVMLAGDTEKADKSYALYTPEHATAFAKTLQGLLDKDDEVLVLNGPRTGKHQLQNGQLVEDKTVHRDPGKQDPVTEAFLAELHNKKVNATLYDFIMGAESAWAPALGLAHQWSLNGQGSRANLLVFIPGESTSMLSEAHAILPPYQVIAYEHPAMQESHSRHVGNGFKKALHRVLTEKGSLQTPKELLHPVVSGDAASKYQEVAAEVIAQKILALIK